jgi:hypothetical protein
VLFAAGYGNPALPFGDGAATIFLALFPISAQGLASAMAGLTLMAGGLAVLRGRRRIKLKA